MGGTTALKHYSKRASRPGSVGSSSCNVTMALDEEHAVKALQGIKRRAKREREELAAIAKRNSITLPKLKFMEATFEEDEI